MTLKERIKADIITATKAKDEATRNVLRVVLGDIDTQEGRGKTLTDEQIYSIARKILQGVEEMLVYRVGDESLLKEKAVLSALIPTQLTLEDIGAELKCKLEEIMAAKSDGQATGIAMKYLKTTGKSVDGTLVGEVIKMMRA